MPTPGQRRHLRIGIDLGGTKIEGVVLDPDEKELARKRVATPRDDYDRTIAQIAALCSDLLAASDSAQHHAGGDSTVTVGIGIPGSMSPKSGLVQNANSTWLNGRTFDRDLSTALPYPVRCANDANCFALSEASDGAGAGVQSVFGVILGTGTGGGLVLDGRIVDGPRAISGEWGHNPLPWVAANELPGPKCWCGRHGCLETWISGPGLARDHRMATGAVLTAVDIAENAAAGDPDCQRTLERHADRVARGLAHVVNIIDPEVIVLGGGLSKLSNLYDVLPGLMEPYIFSDAPLIALRAPHWGDASGVRGAARLFSVKA